MARRKIILRGDPVINEDEVATEAISPGHLLELTPTGWRKNTDDAANVTPIFALEREELGQGIDATYVDFQTSADYASGDAVKAGAFAPGMSVYALLASGHNVAKGDYLTPNTTGLFMKTSVSATVRTAQALEAVDTSASAPTTGTRIRIQIC